MTVTGSDTVCAVFVYGTLKTGECREKCWPCEPLAILKAWTYGELYDTGPHPALIPGGDLVAGQCWLFDPDQISLVLQELDQVEEYRPGMEATNLYNRVVIECVDRMNGRSIQAYTYHYARLNELAYFTRLLPVYSWEDRRLALWPAGADW